MGFVVVAASNKAARRPLTHTHVSMASQFAYTTMTTVGYGDIAAVNNYEKVFAVFAMILGGTVFGYIVGSMASLFGRFNSAEAKYKDKMDEINQYMVS